MVPCKTSIAFGYSILTNSKSFLGGSPKTANGRRRTISLDIVAYEVGTAVFGGLVYSTNLEQESYSY